MPLPRTIVPRRIRPGERLPLAGHLDELRRRVILSALALVVAFAALYAVHDRLLRLIERPLPDHRLLVTLSPTEPFATVVAVVLWAAVLAALPVWLYQLYAFVVPAVGHHSRRRSLAAVGAVAGLFAGGVVVGYLALLPLALRFLLGAGGGLFAVQLRAGEYFSFATTMLLWAGLLFEVPAAMAALARLGILSAATFRRQRRTAIVAIAAIAALLPGGDPVGMLVIMAPLLLLYELGIRLAAILERASPWRGERMGEPEPAGSAREDADQPLAAPTRCSCHQYDAA